MQPHGEEKPSVKQILGSFRPGEIGPSWAVATSENLVNTAGQHKKEEFVELKLSKGIPEPE